jgi:uncharacterized membrane protein
MTTQGADSPTQQPPSLLPTALVGVGFLLVALIFVWSASWYLTFKAVHVLFAVIWVGGGTMLTILGILAERQNDPVDKAKFARRAGQLGERLFTPVSIIVLAAGIAMMMNLDWGWNHFWIIFGLIGFATTFVIGIGILGPTGKRAGALIAREGPASPEAQAMISKLLLVARFDIAVLMLVVVDMVVKPFS